MANNISIVPSSLFERRKACEKLIKESATTKEFYFFLICSSFLAAIGLATNSIAVVIGAMLIAPLFSPLLAVGLGVVLSNTKLVVRELFTVLKALVSVIATSAVAGLLLGFKTIDSQVLIKTSFLEFLFVSFIAGMVGTYIWVKSDLQNMASGVLVAVTILPPLASIGLGLSILSAEVVNISLKFFAVNIIGIIIGSIIMFNLFGFSRPTASIEKAIRQKIKEHEKGAKK